MSTDTSNVRTRPNFLFILIDDMGWRDLSCYGSTFYETPNIDRIAKEGMRFTDAYAACPVCSPTRASILTGKYPARIGLTHYISSHQDIGRVFSAPYIKHLPLEEVTIAKLLRENGYRTYHIGKWHLGGEDYWPEHHGFDVNIGGCHFGSPGHGYFSPYRNPRLTDGPNGEYLTDRLTNEAIRLIKENGSSPFFMYLSHYAVHIPIQVPDRYIQKYQEKAERLGLVDQPIFEKGDYFPVQHKKNRRIVRRLIQSDPKYAGMIENLDENIGRVLNTLDELGIAENTVVVFFSDNGGLSTAESSPTTNLPLKDGKGWMYEGGIRDPLLMRYPLLIKPGTTSSSPVTSTDFFPTFLDLAGLPLRPNLHLDGYSFIDTLKEKNGYKRPPLFWHFPHYGNQGGTPTAAVRDGDYKLIYFFESNKMELYNVSEDIEENHNLAAEHPEKCSSLRLLLDKWFQEVNAKIPEPNPHYKPFWIQRWKEFCQNYRERRLKINPME